MILLKIYAVVMMVIGVYGLITGFLNILFGKKMFKVKVDDRVLKDNPLVSVIIPARDEEESLPRLLDSLIVQTYKNIEILIINDQSSDKTGEIISRYEKLDSRVHGYETEAGVKINKHGKINALLQLIPYAKGDYLLATDADTCHATTSVAHTLACMRKHNLDIVSGFPTELCESYWGCICMSAMMLANIFVPHFIIYKLQLPSLTFGIGQYIMMRRDAYYETGGYSCIKNSVVDDMGIMKLFVENGKKYAFINMSEEVACYMYHTAKDAFKGIERSLVGVFPITPLVVFPIMLAVIALLLISWSPLALIIFACCGIFNIYSALLLLGWFLFCAAFYMGCRNINFRKLVSISGALSMTMIGIMYIHGLYRRLSGKNFIWKGRII